MINPESSPAGKIGLFGGTFDPVHIGHLIVAEWVQDALDLQTVYFIPNFIHPFARKRNISPAEIRLHMLKMAIEPFKKFEISDFEIQKSSVSYAIETIEHFKTLFPNHQLFYFIGADNLPEFHKWHRYRDILEQARLVVYDRKEGYFPDNLPKEKFVFLQTPLIEISSTLIRERIRQGKATRSLLPYGVLEYIQEKGLYGAGSRMD